MTIKLGFGEGSSPVLHGDRIIINLDHEGQSFIVALDKRSGRELWRVDRDEITSWSTPIVVESKGRSQVITSATKRIRSYDLETGELIWQSSGMTRNVIPSPVATGDMVYLMSGFRGSALQAIRFATARDDVAGGDAIVWTREHDTPYTLHPCFTTPSCTCSRGTVELSRRSTPSPARNSTVRKGCPELTRYTLRL